MIFSFLAALGFVVFACHRIYMSLITISPEVEGLIADIRSEYWKCRFTDCTFTGPAGQYFWIYMGAFRPYHGINIYNRKERAALRRSMKWAHKAKLCDPRGEQAKSINELLKLNP